MTKTILKDDSINIESFFQDSTIDWSLLMTGTITPDKSPELQFQDIFKSGYKWNTPDATLPSSQPDYKMYNTLVELGSTLSWYYGPGGAAAFQLFFHKHEDNSGPDITEVLKSITEKILTYTKTLIEDNTIDDAFHGKIIPASEYISSDYFADYKEYKIGVETLDSLSKRLEDRLQELKEGLDRLMVDDFGLDAFTCYFYGVFTEVTIYQELCKITSPDDFFSSFYYEHFCFRMEQHKSYMEKAIKSYMDCHTVAVKGNYVKERGMLETYEDLKKLNRTYSYICLNELTPEAFSQVCEARMLYYMDEVKTYRLGLPLVFVVDYDFQSKNIGQGNTSPWYNDRIWMMAQIYDASRVASDSVQDKLTCYQQYKNRVFLQKIAGHIKLYYTYLQTLKNKVD